MRVIRSAVLSASLTLVAACASPRAADVRLPGAFEAPQPAAPPAGSIALDHWWTTFGDAQLDSLIDSALTANPDARSAAARIREVRATATGTLFGFLPQGDATASAKRTQTRQLAGTVFDFPGFSTSGKSDAANANLNVSWELDLFGRIFAANRAARGDIAAAQFDYEATRASLAAQVADAYFQSRGFSIQLADAREEVRIQEQLLDIASRRAKAGLAATSEADRVAGELSQARAQAETLAGELQAEVRTLLILSGRPFDPLASVDASPTVGGIPQPPATLPSELLARRPDIREAQAQVAAAAGRLTLADLAFFPTFQLTPGVGWQKIAQTGFSATTQSWSIGAAGTQPILSIPTLMQQLKVQDARTEQAVLAYEKTVQTAFGEAENALVRLDADRRRVGILVDGEVSARRSYQASLKGYQLGLTDLQTTLSAEESWRQTRIQLTSARVQGLRGAVTAYQAIGGGWAADAYPKTQDVTRPR